MILSPIDPDRIAAVLDRYRPTLPCGSVGADVFERIAASLDLGADPVTAHRDAVTLTRRFGMAPIDEPPEAAFSWDGRSVRTATEPAVLIHEVAHFQLAAPGRRFLLDFGLGAGPETGRVAEADRAQRLGGEAREIEEQMASLLGVLWEIELGQAGIHAFQEQNWLEGAGRDSTAAFFVATLDRLIALGVVDSAGHPLETLRIRPDA